MAEVTEDFHTETKVAGTGKRLDCNSLLAANYDPAAQDFVDAYYVALSK